MIRKLAILIIGTLLSINFAVASPRPAYADELAACKCADPLAVSVFGNCKKDDKVMFCDGSESGNGIMFLVRTIINILMMGVTVLATIGIVWCGVLILTARDNPGQVQSAKNRMIDVVIGLAVFGLMWVLADLLLPGGSKDMLAGGDGNEGGGLSLGKPTTLTNLPSTGGSSGSSSSGWSSSSNTSAPSIEGRPRSCGPGVPGTPGGPMHDLKEAPGSKTRVYTTTFGQNYYIYNQDDPRWPVLKPEGCVITATYTVAQSFSNSEYFEPKPSGSRLGWGVIQDASNTRTNLHASTSGCSGSTREKIKCTLIDKHGSIIIYTCNGNKCPGSGKHGFPIIDYKVEKGTEYFFLGNTVNYSSKPRFKQGWVRANDILSEQVIWVKYLQPTVPQNCLQ